MSSRRRSGNASWNTPKKANDLVATAGLAAWRHQLGIGGPRLSIAIPVVDRGDVLQDHVFGLGHQLSDCSLTARVSQMFMGRAPALAPTIADRAGTFG